MRLGFVGAASSCFINLPITFLIRVTARRLEHNVKMPLGKYFPRGLSPIAQAVQQACWGLRNGRFRVVTTLSLSDPPRPLNPFPAHVYYSTQARAPGR